MPAQSLESKPAEGNAPSEAEVLGQIRAQRDWMIEHADKDCASAVSAHLKGYATDEQIRSWITLYHDTVIPAIPDFVGSTGVDFGCWSGIGSSILARLGAARVFCAEVNAEVMRFGPRWAEQFGLDQLRFAWNVGGVIPLPNRSVDWVYVNQVFCNMDPAGFDQAIAEISRILRTDGRLVFCDSNNPHCPQTLERLERIYRVRELGEGDEQNPAGVLYINRLRRIKAIVPDISDDDARRLARNTCYLGGSDLVSAIHRWRYAGVEPSSPFAGGWAKAPVNPLTGIAAGNLTDPYDLAARFRAHGIRTSINTAATEGPSDPAELLDRMTRSQSFYILGRKV